MQDPYLVRMTSLIRRLPFIIDFKFMQTLAENI